MKESYTSRAVLWGAAFFISAAGAAYAAWQIETVASVGDVGDGCSLAVDRWGRPHISYVDKTGAKVMYAYYAGSSWEFETVAAGVEVPGFTGLALDSTDKPHIIFHDADAGELTYARRSGTNWVTEMVDSFSDYCQFVSIIAWPLDPRVSYSSVGSSWPRLRYAYRDNEGWHRETVVSSGGGASNTIFLDANNDPNIVYFNVSTSSVRRAVLKNEEWSIDDIAEGVDPGAVVGPDNKIHVGFPTLSNDGLNYAVSTSGGSWKIDNVPRVVGEPAFTDIAVNAAGNIFISYFNFRRSNLHAMIKKGTSWTHELVVTGGYVGYPHSSGISGDYPLIAYYDGNNKDLKLARYDPETDVELTHFAAERSSNGVELRWAVNDDGAAAGFNLYRNARDGERVKVNAELITGASPFRYRDASARADAAYEYWLEAVTLGGEAETFGPARVPAASERRAFALHQNVPNPCNVTATFGFELPEAADVTFAFYDVKGRKVYEAVPGRFSAGRHEVPLDLSLPPGVYVYRLNAGGESAARKMVVAR